MAPYCKCQDFSRLIKNNDFFWSVLDCKKQNEFQYNSGQLMEWLSGIADIKR